MEARERLLLAAQGGVLGVIWGPFAGGLLLPIVDFGVGLIRGDASTGGLFMFPIAWFAAFYIGGAPALVGGIIYGLLFPRRFPWLLRLVVLPSILGGVGTMVGLLLFAREVVESNGPGALASIVVAGAFGAAACGVLLDLVDRPRQARQHGRAKHPSTAASASGQGAPRQGPPAL